jgi:hypothetical protein
MPGRSSDIPFVYPCGARTQLTNVRRELEDVTVRVAEVQRPGVTVILVSELDPVRVKALLRGVEFVDDHRDMPKPGRLGLTGRRLSLRLEQAELQPRPTKKDRLVILGRLIELWQPKHVPVPRDRARAVGDVERDVIETLKLHAGR